MNALAKVSSIFIVDRDHRSVDAYARRAIKRSNLSGRQIQKLPKGYDLDIYKLVLYEHAGKGKNRPA